MKILVTGTAGFIGYHFVKRLLDRGDTVFGMDNINDYYDVNLKLGRLKTSGIDTGEIDYNKKIKSKTYENYVFIKMNLEDREAVLDLFGKENFDMVFHLAAQAGVRYSIENPHAYIDSNIRGFINILEGCRHNKVKHLAYASSSSVYGLNEKMPFCTSDNVDHPISLYAASKKANELMAHTYSHLYGLPTTGVRFFTVYGPWGRPDMALFIFTKAIFNNEQIDVFNNGDMKRDFTYISDINEGMIRILDNPPAGNNDWSGANPDPSSSKAPYRIYNIGNSSPVNLIDFIGAIEKAVGKKAKKNFLPMQPGDVPVTFADVEELVRDFDYKPSTSIQEGVDEFVKWYREYYGI
ncbi:NAD-dependent epimerase [Spirochaetota bacterium]